MFSEKLKETTTLSRRKQAIEQKLRFERDADTRQALFDELQGHHARLAELDTIPDAHMCIRCGEVYSAASANLKFSIRALVVCNETGRPIEQVDYRPVRFAGACAGCMDSVKAYLEAQA